MISKMKNKDYMKCTLAQIDVSLTNTCRYLYPYEPRDQATDLETDKVTTGASQ